MFWLEWFWCWLERTAGSCSEGAETSAADGDEHLGINLFHQYSLHKVGVCPHPKLFSAGLKEESGEREGFLQTPLVLSWCGKLSMLTSHSLLSFLVQYISLLEYNMLVHWNTEPKEVLLCLRKIHLDILSVKGLAEILLHACKKILRIYGSLFSFSPIS